jgi:glycosyltransferase involved in cell wall biosynthesis
VKRRKYNSNQVEVSVVVPIYNGSAHVRSKLESLTNISGVNYEVIIPLNLSSDDSTALVRKSTANIPNVTLIEHRSLVSLGENFYSGVTASKGKYIFVTAVDDMCSKNFYRDAVDKLNENESAIAITPITKYIGNYHGGTEIEFELVGDLKQRIITLKNNFRVSHGIFYSMIRRDTALRLYEDFKKESSFMASDWFFDIKLALDGEVLRSKNSVCFFGVKGLSRQVKSLNKEDDKILNRVFPYYTLARNIFWLSRGKDLHIKWLFARLSTSLLVGNLHRFTMHLWKSFQ